MVRFLCISLLMCFCASITGAVELSTEQWNKLDTFEAYTLSKADQTYSQKQYRQAAAEYDSFIIEFPQSEAIPYALMKKGLALRSDNKQYNAIKVFTEVMDYFPNVIQFAAPALYYIGLCHWENGDVAKAMTAWVEMADDKDYSRHSLAADAINRLADNLQKQDKMPQAVKYYAQVAVDFRDTNPNAARQAMTPVIEYYVRTSPNHAKLYEFYKNAKSFEHNPQKISDDNSQNTNYWLRLSSYIWQYNNFNNLQVDAKREYFKYWADIFEGKYGDWDDFQINLADFRFHADGDSAKREKHLDNQFQKGFKPGDYDRITKWIKLYADNKKKVLDYHSKYDFNKMNTAQINDVMVFFFDNMKDPALAKNVYDKFKMDKISDTEKGNIARYLWRVDRDLVIRTYQAFADADAGKHGLLLFYHWSRDHQNGLPLATELTSVEKYSTDAWYRKAEFLQWTRKYQEAIEAYKSWGVQPVNLWRIADCYIGMSKAESALAQLQEIENFFTDQAPAAAMRIAYVYRDLGNKDKYIAKLRSVLKKYPKSGQSSVAHQELEKMGIQIGGAVDAE
ncbi:MAG: tetratricopeptide repeat protein [Lentisphaerae bacterium]|nr:tetratricopeptide repeat protein [Lentisphaerota bacterium]